MILIKQVILNGDLNTMTEKKNIVLVKLENFMFSYKPHLTSNFNTAANFLYSRKDICIKGIFIHMRKSAKIKISKNKKNPQVSYTFY